MNIDQFLIEYVTSDCRENARKDLRLMFQDWRELEHESEIGVMLEEDLEGDE